jgi:hypothetical protein
MVSGVKVTMMLNVLKRGIKDINIRVYVQYGGRYLYGNVSILYTYLMRSHMTDYSLLSSCIHFIMSLTTVLLRQKQ